MVILHIFFYSHSYANNDAALLMQRLMRNGHLSLTGRMKQGYFSHIHYSIAIQDIDLLVSSVSRLARELSFRA